MRSVRRDPHSPRSSQPDAVRSVWWHGGNWTWNAENPVPERILSSVWADVANGQLSSDGKNVYGICDVAVKQAVDNLIQGVNMLVPRGSRQSFNLLRSWDLETEGKILWEVGGETGEDEPLLSGALFLGAPTPCRGELLTLAELNGEVYLLSLSPKNGKLKWWQQLAANTSLPLPTTLPDAIWPLHLPSTATWLFARPFLDSWSVTISLPEPSLGRIATAKPATSTCRSMVSEGR